MELQDPFCDSSSKNEGGCVHLCQNSVTFTLPTTVTPVEWMLASTVALVIFFSCCNTSLFLNDNIFIRLCCWALHRTYKPGKKQHVFSWSKNKGIEKKWQHRIRKELNFPPISLEIQLPETTFKPISTADRNVVRQAKFCVLNLADLVLLMCWFMTVDYLKCFLNMCTSRWCTDL